MSLWRHVVGGWRVLARREAADRDLTDEVRHFLDEAAREYVAAGLSPEAAQRRARVDMGNVASVRDQVRASGWEHGVATCGSDLRYGIRRLRRDAAFTIVAVTTLALGIGTATAIFSVVHPILLDPLPYPDASKLVAIADRGTDFSPIDVAFGSFREVLARGRSFDALAVMKPWQPTMVGADRPERLEGQRVSADYFRALGIEPVIGRGFHEADDRTGAPDVVVLGQALWRRRFAADPDIVGRDITLDDVPYTVIGVMPRHFENVTAPSAELWSPLQYDVSLPTNGREWGHHLKMVARLRPSVDLDGARRELRTIAATRVPDFPRVPWATLSNGLLVTSLQDSIAHGVAPALVAVFGGVLVLLVIACVNVTNLQLARSAQRRPEFAMRAALGASRGRLTRQMLTESLVLALAAGAVGMLVAQAGLGALMAIAPGSLPRMAAIHLDVPSFGFAFAVAVVVALATGIVPAVHGRGHDLLAGIQHASWRIGRPHRQTRRWLVIAEIGLAVVLLVGAGLMLHSIRRLYAVDPGFDAAHVVAMQVQTAGRAYASGDATHRFFAYALESARGVAGVQSAGFTSQVPLTGSADMYGIRMQTMPGDRAEPDGPAVRYAVTPGYLEAMNIAIRQGRPFDSHDTAEAPYVALISESLARSRSADGDAIGRWLRIGSNTAPWRRIVGVVANVRQRSLGLDETDAVYVPSAQWTEYVDRAMWLVVRTHGERATPTADIQNAIWRIDKDQPIVRVSTMAALVAKSEDERRFVLSLIETFAAIALVMAAVGVYGILAGSVTERTREIGVRAALGATRRDILRLVIGEGVTLTLLGIGFGLLGAAAAGQVIRSLLFEVSPVDPTTYIGVVGLLALVSALAWGLPASRAANIDAATALRRE